jgi:hypothetical protein
MISEKLTEQIEAEGRKKGFRLWKAYGKRDEKGEFTFFIELKPDAPPDLGVKVSDGLGIEMKRG